MSAPGHRAQDRASDDGARSVAIVGGGLIGLCSAFFLHRSGCRVTIVERAVLGSGTSRGNAGMLARRAKPLSAPGVVKDGLHHVLAGTGAFYVPPSAVLGLLPFLTRFAVRSNDPTIKPCVDALDVLNRRGAEMFDVMRGHGIGTGVNREGSLLVYRDRAGASAAHASITSSASANPGLVERPGEMLDAEGLKELEPMLGSNARWGFQLSHVWWADPNTFVDELIGWVRHQEIRVVEGCEVLRVRDDAGGARLVTTGADITADLALVCAGAWSSLLVRPLDRRIHIAPGKGYSFSVDPGDRGSRRCIGFQDIHVVSVPLSDGRVRFAGTMEFDRRFDGLRLARVRAIVEHLRDYVVIDVDDRRDLWVGPRPMTPDGIPYIGRVDSCRNVFVASGHNMEGFTLAPATGSLVADLLRGPADTAAASLSPRRAGGMADLLIRRGRR